MPSYGLSIGLVPVQGWIADSGRSRDLLAGSVFLSWLMARVLTEISEAEGVSAEILLPLPPEDRTFAELSQMRFSEALGVTYGVPNRASGILQADDRERIRSVLESLQARVDDAFQGWCDHFLKPDLFPGKLRPVLVEQVSTYGERTAGGADCPISVVWVAAALDEAPEARELLSKLDRLYSEVKRTRPIRPWLWGARVGKCNQCGKREALGPVEPGAIEERSRSETFRVWLDWYDGLSLEPWIERGIRLESGERLCPICLARRNSGYATAEQAGSWRFPSTGEVAVAPWVRAVEEAAPESGGEDVAPAEALDRLRATSAGRSDLGRTLLMSEETLRHELGEQANEVLARLAALEKAMRAWNSSRPAEKELLPLRPSPYLALLVFDGDDMGRHVRMDPSEVPRRMRSFAREAREILEEAAAAVFYLAGDEGLAMVPAVEAMEVARKIRAGFGLTFGTAEDAPTLCAALAFFEFTRPLSGAISAAHESLRRAKSTPRKNALAVSVETASGNRWGIVRRWGSSWDRLAAAVGLIGSGTLSAGWAYDAEDFVRRLPSEAWKSPHSVDAAREELRRLFFRRCPARDVAPERRFDRREELWEYSGGSGWLTDFGPESVASLADQFHLISFLARQSGAVAGGEEQEVA